MIDTLIRVALTGGLTSVVGGLTIVLWPQDFDPPEWWQWGGLTMILGGGGVAVLALLVCAYTYIWTMLP